MNVSMPGEAVQITLLATEALPASESDRQSFIRWKLNKTVPLDVSSAQVACEVLGENRVVDLLTGLGTLLRRPYSRAAPATFLRGSFGTVWDVLIRLGMLLRRPYSRTTHAMVLRGSVGMVRHGLIQLRRLLPRP